MKVNINMRLIFLGSLWLTVLCAISNFGTQVAKADLITFQNTTRIAVVDNAVSNPYPSAIAVSGVQGVLTDLTVTLFGLSHTWPNDLAAVIVAPSGTSVILFSGPGDRIPAVGLNWSFNDNAAARLPDSGALSSGTYRPGQEQFDEFFPLPGPGGKLVDSDPAPWQFEFQSLLPQNPNGDWRLFVKDSQAADTGSISGGWSITFNVTAVPEPSVLCMVWLALPCMVHVRRRRILVG